MHDPIYKELYSLPEPVEELLRALAPRRSRLVDFASLSRLPADYVTSGQAPRYGDMLWECRLRSGTVLLIVIEFQSTVDHDMLLRLFEYTARALREWARPSGLGASDRIPLVLPLLVYSGKRPWTTPTAFAELRPPTDPEWVAGQPEFQYLLLEERPGGTSPLPDGNLVGELVRLVRARQEDEAIRVLNRLRDRVADNEGGALDRALAARVRSLVLDLQGDRATHLGAARTMKEVMDMIKPTGHWASFWYEDGEEKGIEKGRSQGIEEGRLTLLRQQINRKFGADTVRELFDAPDLRLDRERVNTLANAVVDCDTAEELLARVGDGMAAERT
ncbi:MAG: Rpn family recombination-promoting nuclease/putative transposase [Gemmatimonadota bacterium]|nr:Rpn family recombination-promoting nuclease/putative transposase [Gemmatimonadota bacterium]MDE2865938.1 Rpn family recombination-promoting nuclease/putative transposase [Gemmatimonadota bacterium]